MSFFTSPQNLNLNLNKQYPDSNTYTTYPDKNPHLVLINDIIRSTKTLQFHFDTGQLPSLDRGHDRTMRGYFGIMRTESCVCDLHGNGERVHIEDKHCLWSPKADAEVKEPLWHLRVSVVKDQEARGDCPSRRFAFRSMHHLTHAANQIEAAFSDSFDIKKCGFQAPDAMGGRVNDGRSENITIEFDSDNSKEGWKEFLAKLQALEDEWDHEARNEGLIVS